MGIMGFHNSLCDTKHKELRDIFTCKELLAVDGRIKASCGNLQEEGMGKTEWITAVNGKERVNKWTVQG
jgi:hypothetical protein